MNSAAGTEAGQYSCQPILNSKKKFLLPMADNRRGSSSSSSSSSLSSSSYHFCSITQMNLDHLIYILQLLPVESILSFSMTCKKFRSLASSESLWEFICRREWGSPHVSAFLSSLSLPEKRRISWKRLHQQVSQMGSLHCTRLASKEGIFPVPRASHSLNCVSGYLVLFGGGCEGGRHLNDTWIAHVGNGPNRFLGWQQVKSESPGGRFGHTCIAVGNSLFLFGGITDTGIRQNDTWVGQVVEDGSSEIRLSWKLLDVGGVSPCPRGAHAGCSIGDSKMVIHGGIGLNGVRLDDVWLLDISKEHTSGSWQLITTIGPSPPARSGHTLTWIGGKKMVLFGGRGTGYDVLNDVWLFDLDQESQWMEVVYDCPPEPGWVPRPRVGHSAIFVLGGRVLVYGGEDSLRHRKDDFWLLDVNSFPSTGEAKAAATVKAKTVLGKMWRRMTAHGQSPECRSFHTSCADQTGRYFYVFGGMVDGGLDLAEEYGMRFDGKLFLVEIMVLP